MRRVFLLLVVLVLCVTCANAEQKGNKTYKSGDFEYALTSDGNAILVGFTGKGTELTIPKKVNGKPVTGIADEAFHLCSSLKSVHIPNNVVEVGTNPFVWCSSLSEVSVNMDHSTLAMIDDVLFDKTEKRLIYYPSPFVRKYYEIPNGISIIGDKSFYGSKWLKGVEIPESIKSIGEYAFYGCSDLDNVNIPNSIATISKGAFYACDSMKNIYLPESIVSIEDYAFQYCKELKEINIPSGVQNIGNYAFYMCLSIEEVTLPSSILSIGDNPFYDCEKLERIIVYPDNPTLALVEGVLYDKTQKRVVACPPLYDVSSYSIPSGIIHIGSHAFLNCAQLKTIDIPESVLRIGEGAFSGCSRLNHVIIPNHISEIGNQAFSSCTNLSSIKLPDELCLIGDGMFYNCGSLKEIILPENIESIGVSAFGKCTGLKSIVIPNSVTNIAEDAFEGCWSHLTLTVEKGSYAESYAKKHDLSYIYPDTNDWLNQ